MKSRKESCFFAGRNWTGMEKATATAILAPFWRNRQNEAERYKKETLEGIWHDATVWEGKVKGPNSGISHIPRERKPPQNIT